MPSLLPIELTQRLTGAMMPRRMRGRRESKFFFFFYTLDKSSRKEVPRGTVLAKLETSPPHATESGGRTKSLHHLAWAALAHGAPDRQTARHKGRLI